MNHLSDDVSQVVHGSMCSARFRRWGLRMRLSSTVYVEAAATRTALILRSPPKAGVSKDGHKEPAPKCIAMPLAGRGPSLLYRRVPPAIAFCWPASELPAAIFENE
ncbi:hypothetical protein CVM73_10890 [Bradyrhizobium forestalis]|uniref:Uncharacterized protein n=1 Tax=Bradyrhizobium forestalis TaxID=1419263 RepID=A0A2M8RB73_9BRAD|nr:hypothetical protein CVM73_10890 [Bradyrhizobium forestalis]